MPYLTQKEVEEQFNKKQIEWLSPDPLEPQYMIPDMKAIKSHIHSLRQSDIQSHIEKLNDLPRRTWHRIDGTECEVVALSDMQTYFESLLTK